MRPHAEWKVMIQIARATVPTPRSTRSFISPAALFVKVMAKISLGLTPCAARRCATRCVSTRVLPEPAPAITSSGPSVVRTASRWASFRSARPVFGCVADTPPRLATTLGAELLRHFEREVVDGQLRGPDELDGRGNQELRGLAVPGRRRPRGDVEARRLAEGHLLDGRRPRPRPDHGGAGRGVDGLLPAPPRLRRQRAHDD